MASLFKLIAAPMIAMAKFSNAKNKEMFDDLAANGEASEFYKTVFAGQKFETVSAWDGAVGQARR